MAADTTRTHLSFRFRGQTRALDRFAPRTTLLDWLREEAGATGTKEGCGEGDCGACTVVLSRPRGGGVSYEPVNACILLLGQIDGAELITVEDLAEGQTLHPVQQAMVDFHGSQCGFCTPGIVMSLFAHYHSGVPATRESVDEALAGNLCRCTGYKPIVDAALATCDGAPADRFAATADARAEALLAAGDDRDLFVGDEAAFFAAPASEASLAALYASHPDAVLLAGGDRRRALDHQAVQGPEEDHLARPRRRARRDREPARRASARRRRDFARRHAAPAGAASGSRPDDVAASARCRCAPAARSAATSPTARRSAISPPALIALGARVELRQRRGVARARRSRISSSPMAGRTARPANTCARSMSRGSAPTKPFAPSRSPSGSTRISRR